MNFIKEKKTLKMDSYRNIQVFTENSIFENKPCSS